MPYRQEAEVVLAMWREAERRLRSADHGSPEAAEAQADVARLREEYQRLTELARQHHRPEPPPLPDALRDDAETAISPEMP